MSNTDSAEVEAIAAETETPAASEQERSEFFDELAEVMDALEEDVRFEDIDDLFESEEAEHEGRWFPWPAMPGMEIHIAHFSSCMDRRNELEEKLRKRKGIAPGVPLSDKVSEQLWRESFFGTVVRGWRGAKRGGYEFVFNLQNFRKMQGSRYFRGFVMKKSKDAENFRAQRVEEISGNSPTA